MDMKGLPSTLWTSVIGIALLVYVGYCSSKGGTHVKGRGWVTKSEAPTSYLINMVTCVIFGLLMIGGPSILHFLR